MRFPEQKRERKIFEAKSASPDHYHRKAHATLSTAFFGTLIRIDNIRRSHEANQIRLPIFPTARALPIFEP